MDKNYRELSQKIQHFLSSTVMNDSPEIFEVIQEKQNQTDKIMLLIKKELQIPLSSFLASHIHMMVNRQYTSKQRMYESLIYDHLHRYYKTMEYRVERQSQPFKELVESGQ